MRTIGENRSAYPLYFCRGYGFCARGVLRIIKNESMHNCNANAYACTFPWPTLFSSQYVIGALVPTVSATFKHTPFAF